MFFKILSFLLILFIFLQNKNKKNINKNTKISQEKIHIIKTLTRQCSRWLVAAQQDESPLIATLHVQYGMGYLWAIKDIATTTEFKHATGLEFLKFEKHSTNVQDNISKRMIKACPQFSGDIDTYLAQIAGEV